MAKYGAYKGTISDGERQNGDGGGVEGRRGGI